MSASIVQSLSTKGVIAHRLLLVDDDAKFADETKQFLEQNGFTVLLAKDGGQAHATFVMRKPDFVIVDLILPGESGFEVCERMKQSDKTVPVLVLSAIDMEDSRELAARVGADEYLTKPCPPQQLLEAISKVAEKVWARTHGAASSDEGRVRFNCRCGKRFKVSSAHRGKTLTCPDCGEPVQVPRHD